METGYPDIDSGLHSRDNRPLVFGPPYNPINATAPNVESTVLVKVKEMLKDMPESICQEAHRIVNGERDQSYGTALKNFTIIGKLWSVILGIEVTPEQVGLCMALLKFAREVNKHKRDNLVDACGYLLCTQNLIEEKEKSKNG